MSAEITVTDADVARCKARLLEPGASYLVTRSCHQSQFLWHPTRDVRMLHSRAGKPRSVDVAQLLKNTQGFLLGVAAQRYNIGIHGYAFLSDHNHIDLQDRLGLMPDFFRWFNGLLARATNRYRQRPAQSVVLAPGSYNAVQTTCPKSAMHAVAYTAIQAVRHGLTSRVDEWPGLHCDPEHLFEGQIFFRDDEFFFRGEREFIDDFSRAPREQQVAYLEELAESERRATARRVAEHIAKLPAGTCFGVDPFSEGGARQRQLDTQAEDYVPVVLSVEELAEFGPLVVSPRVLGDSLGQALATVKRKRGPLDPAKENLTIAVPTAAMRDIARQVRAELSSRPLPPAVLLKVEKHAQWADVSDEEYLRQLQATCDELIAEANEVRKRPIIGMKRIRSEYRWRSFGTHRRRHRRPLSRHRDGSERLVNRDRIHPTFMTRTAGGYRKLLRRLKTFRRSYAERRIAFERGRREVEMPWGTYLLVVRFHAKCAAPPH